MHKIRYESDLYTIIFFFIGIGFLAFSFLSGGGLVKATAHSTIQDPKQLQYSFLSVSAFLFLAGAVCKYFSLRTLQREKRLTEDGLSLFANVQEVRELRSVRLKCRRPYVILYNFKLEGCEHRGKSHLFWEKPEIQEGSRIKILADGKGHSIVVL